jgi:hypothetical protein
MSSEISTDRDRHALQGGASKTDAPYVHAGPDAGFQPWHFFLLLSMVGATVAVALTDATHPAALILLSAAVVAAGFAGYAAYRALGALFGFMAVQAPLTESARDGLLREKALTLRSIKELEFDRAMGKIGDADFQDLSSRLRARALLIMEELDGAPARPRDVDRSARPRAAQRRACTACGTPYDEDARFCKQCGKAVA